MEIERFEKYLKRKIIDAMRNNIVPEDFTCTVFGSIKTKSFKDIKDIDVVCITREYSGEDLANIGYNFYTNYLRKGYKGKPIDFFITNPDTGEIYDSSDLFYEKTNETAPKIAETIKNIIKGKQAAII
ncbi:MAG: hypothetical protein LWW95_10720 [Candidatus Desulfofervidus auxilii]|nr:hypothetical protein [Candidatus Desulfofervidus auxilii]